MSNNSSDKLSSDKDKKVIEIFHLYHSGVALIIDDSLLIFDYYNDKIDNDKSDNNERSLRTGVIDKNDLRRFNQIYVFVSHRHSDHYNPVIFDWVKANPDIYYILSSDIQLDMGKLKNLEDKVFFTDKDSSLELDNLYIETYGSTDLGVSFLLQINNFNIFHAGDLNWWHWKSFSSDELKKEEEDYKSEINKLKGKNINIAFVPVDPRLEEYYYLAGEYFIQEIHPELFVPIHFADNYEISKEFADKIKSSQTEIAMIKGRGDSILI
ncbi:MAG: MBL fold metallo-hydrolase [Halanaerobiaceae bacterium]